MVWCDAERDTPDCPDLAILRKWYGRALRNIFNVKELRIADGISGNAPAASDEFHWMQIFKDALSDSPKEWPNRFGTLEYLKIHAPNIKVEDYSCIFRIPSLRFLYLVECYQPTPFQNWNIPASSCGIEFCDLGYSLMDISAVIKILSSLKKLRMFEFRYQTHFRGVNGIEYHSWPLYPWPSLSWAEMRLALMQHKDTLERLCLGELLHDDIIARACPKGSWDTGSLGSLHDFPNLRIFMTQLDLDVFLGPGQYDMEAVASPSLTSMMVLLRDDPAQLDRYPGFIRSLQDVFVPGRNNQLVLIFMDDFPFEKCHLYGALKPLEEAGVKVQLGGYLFQDPLEPLTLTKLGELENDGIAGEQTPEGSVESSNFV